MSSLKLVRVACLLVGLLLAGPQVARAADPPLNLETLSVSDLQQKLAAGQLTSVQLTRSYIDRIAAVNARGPGFNAVRVVNPAALQDAALLDLERATGHVKGPLHGIPVLVNDQLDVAGLPTSGGSLALQSSVPAADSAVVARLRAAGAVILGKTNVTEFAGLMSSSLPNGYSSLGGQVLNPYDIDATPNGPSSGSAAAAAAGLAAITVGAEASGALATVAAAQGGVGVRPTLGLVSRAGMLPGGTSQDAVGPITRSVADAATELQAIAGKDPQDPATDGAPASVPNYLAALTPTALNGKRIGVINNTNAQYQAAILAIQALGATTVQIPTPTPAQNFPDVVASEFKRDLNAYLGRLPASAPMKSLADIIAYNDAHADEALKFGQQQLADSQKIDLSDPAVNATYVANRDGGRAASRTAIDTALTTNTLDAIMTPSATLTTTGARAGYPQVVVPAGYNAANRLPVGIAFNGTAYSEEKLLAFAYAYEQKTLLRQPVSAINPAVWRCYSGAPRSCPPGREVATGVSLDFPLETATVADLQARMTAGTLTATQLTKAYLQRIALTNTEGPSITAVRRLNPKALQEAAALDAERAAGHVRGPLHGIPVIVKDNLDAAGIPTTAGSVALENSVPDKDSPVVAKLRAAGAILLGKANLSEFANFLTNNMPSGYSSLGGQVLNPYNADITPSGSSSGSGAIAAERPGDDHDRHRDQRLDRLALGGAGDRRPAAHDRPRLAHRHRADLSDAGHRRPDDPHRRRRGGGALGDRRQGPGGPGHGDGAGHGPGLPRGALADGPGRQADRRDQQHQRPVRRGGRRCPGARRDDGHGVDAQFQRAVRHPHARVQARPQRVPEPAPGERADEDADGHQELQRRPPRGRDEVRPVAGDRQRRDRPDRPGAERRLRHGARHPAPGRAAGDRQPAHARDARSGRRRRGDPDARGHPDGHRRPRRLPAARRSRRLRGRLARSGRDRLQRHGLQRGEAARVRLRLRAADVAAQAAERDQPEPVALRARQRVHGHHARVRAEHARQRGRRRRPRSAARVPATLSLTLGAPATFGAFTPGIAKTYTAATTATVISSAGDATITVTDPSTNHPGYLVNGSFALPQPLQGLGVVKTYAGPVSNDVVPVTFTQPIAATDPLRTGAYSKTLTFTLSTTNP